MGLLAVCVGHDPNRPARSRKPLRLSATLLLGWFVYVYAVHVTLVSVGVQG